MIVSISDVVFLQLPALPPETRTYFMIVICLHLAVAYLMVGRGRKQKRRAW
jgi:hypothetical protein